MKPAKQLNKILTLAIGIVLLFTFFNVFGLPEVASSRTTFTWIGQNVTEELAYWAAYLNFENVAVRYVTEAEATESLSNLAKYDITFWKQVPGNLQGTPDNTVNGYKTVLFAEMQNSPSGKIYLDDCDATYNIQGAAAFNNLLEAIRQIQNNNVILCFYYTDMTPHYSGLFSFMESVDLTSFDIDLYFPPGYYPTKLPDARTLGVYLWCWSGSGEYQTIGEDWDTITEEAVTSTFSKVQEAEVERMLTWMGYETSGHERGMEEASLYLHPEWWDTIRTLNNEFLESK